MKKLEEHHFYLLKAKGALDLDSKFYRGLPEEVETDQYVSMGHCSCRNGLIEYLSTFFTGLSSQFQYCGVSLITGELDGAKLTRVLTGWSMVIKEMAETVVIDDWKKKYSREELLEFVEQLKDMAKQVEEHQDYSILCCGTKDKGNRK